jgi:hypothetical protein
VRTRISLVAVGLAASFIAFIPAAGATSKTPQILSVTGITSFSWKGGATTLTIRTQNAVACAIELRDKPPFLGVTYTKGIHGCGTNGKFTERITLGRNPSGVATLAVFWVLANKGRTTVTYAFTVRDERDDSVTSGQAPTSSTTVTTSPATLEPVKSPSWAGYVMKGAAGSFQAVSAEWTVPTLNCESTPDGYTSDWVGVDGTEGSLSDLFQTGTEPGCVDGKLVDEAWWTDQALNWVPQDLFSVAGGNEIRAEVSIVGSGQWEYYIADLTTGQSSEHVEGYSGPAASAEWIAEDPPPSVGASPGTLANFGSVTFTDLGLLTPSGSWSDPPYSNAYDVVSSTGVVEEQTSLFSGQGTAASFTVTYEGPNL